MRSSRLIARSLWYHRRSHAAVFAGCILSAAILTGALLVGDSTRNTLRSTALARLGTITYAMQPHGRFFSHTFPQHLADQLDTPITSVLALQGMALHDTSPSRQANRVRVYGVADDFWTLSNAPDTPTQAPPPNTAFISQSLARTLSITPGQEIALRLLLPSDLSRDAPLSSRSQAPTKRVRVMVTVIVPDAALGRFSLNANQLPPHNLFVNRTWLQTLVALPDQANLALAGPAHGHPITTERMNQSLNQNANIQEMGFLLSGIPTWNGVQLTSRQILFHDTTFDDTLMKDGIGTFLYLATAISHNNGTTLTRTPYSFISGMTPSANRALSHVPLDMTDNQIVINEWLASHLAVKPGDTLTVAYYELTSPNRFDEKTRSFTVHSVLSMNSLTHEKALTPDFPGLTDVETCSDWDIGMPLDEKDIQDDANEAYWDAHRATPKAFVTLTAAHDMWGSPFGNLTAVRYPRNLIGSDFVSRLNNSFIPAASGYTFRPVREQALAAATGAVDLGQLFLGMSFFLMIASLMLTGLLFVFSMQQRAEEMGTLLALGYQPKHVRRLLLIEAAAIASLGSVLGASLGPVVTRLLLHGLRTAWQGAVAGAAITYHAEPASLLIGALASTLCSLLAMALTARKHSKRTIRELLQEDPSLAPPPTSTTIRSRRLRSGALILALLGAGTCVIAGLSTATSPAPAFFGSGALLLAAGLLALRIVLDRFAHTSPDTTPSVTQLGLRNTARRPSRSITCTAMLACGCFMIFAVSSMHEDLTRHAEARTSGTGGFELFAESTVPLVDDLNTAKGRERFRLREPELPVATEWIPIKVREGDDASCLNLNKAATPALLGVNPQRLAELNAFGGAELWQQLTNSLPDGTIPALVGDSDTAMWGLKANVGPISGDTIDTIDQAGQTVKVKLVGKLPMRLSVFQGHLLISERSFMHLYPAEEGHRMFLIDTPPAQAPAVTALLSRKLSRMGMEIIPTLDRLRLFYTVESTYLAMFLVLGGLGLVLGTAGMGIVLLRNLVERRAELAILRALGYSRKAIRNMVMVEHAALLALGIGLALIASAIAMYPSLASPGVTVPLGTLSLFLMGTVLFCILWIVLATWIGLRGNLVSALRKE